MRAAARVDEFIGIVFVSHPRTEDDFRRHMELISHEENQQDN